MTIKCCLTVNSLSELQGSASVRSLVVYWPQADPLVLGSGSQQPLSGILVVREGHAEGHVGVVLQNCQRSQLLPAKHPYPVVPARRRQQLTISSDTQLGNTRVHQRHTVLELNNKREEEHLVITCRLESWGKHAETTWNLTFKGRVEPTQVRDRNNHTN